MQFESLTLHTPDPAALLPFYVELLGLPGHLDDAGALHVKIGPSRLTFRPGPEARYHYAINITESRFAEAAAWLAERTPLLRAADGRETFHFENWDAHALYFLDPAGNIGELIARHALPGRSDGPFGTADLLSLSEIGLAVPDVPATVAGLGRTLGITPYRGSAGEEFTAMGDDSGLLIVVRRGRIWFPDTGFPALALPVLAVVALEDGRRATISADPATGDLTVVS